MTVLAQGTTLCLIFFLWHCRKTCPSILQGGTKPCLLLPEAAAPLVHRHQWKAQRKQANTRKLLSGNKAILAIKATAWTKEADSYNHQGPRQVAFPLPCPLLVSCSQGEKSKLLPLISIWQITTEGKQVPSRIWMSSGLYCHLTAPNKRVINFPCSVAQFLPFWEGWATSPT